MSLGMKKISRSDQTAAPWVELSELPPRLECGSPRLGVNLAMATKDMEMFDLRDSGSDHAPADPVGASSPLLSVVIPAYNVAPYIRAAVESALAQTLRSLEVIVVDDGSTDDTSAVLDAIERDWNDPRLRVIRQENGGPSVARNTGISDARGVFIGFLDPDDIWAPEKAALQIALMQQDETIGIGFSNSEYLTEEGLRTGYFLRAKKARPSLHDMIRCNHTGNGSTPIVRRECFQIAGLFRPELRSCEDYEMWCRILALTRYRAELYPRPLTMYRMRRSSLTFDFAKFVENADRAMDFIRLTMPDVPAYVIRAGQAEHYRTAAWKAVSSDRAHEGVDLLMRAVSLHPYILFSDWRVSATALGVLLPEGVRNRLHSEIKKLQRSYQSLQPEIEINPRKPRV
jgi:glycosyltransferase involved in cell wall biosynthesis